MHSIGAYTFRLVMAGLIVGMSTRTASAYLDPGTGSIILQVLLGGVAGLLLAGKLYWHRLLIMLGMQLLISAVNLDLQSVPREPINTGPMRAAAAEEESRAAGT